MNIADKLIELRNTKGVSLSVAAKESGVSKSNLHKMEKNPSSNPSMDILILLAKYYDVSIDFLAGLNARDNFSISRSEFENLISDNVLKIESNSGKSLSEKEIAQLKENTELALNFSYIYVK